MNHTKEGSLLTDIILETFKLNGLLVVAGDQLTKDFGITSARWKILGAISNEMKGLTVPEIARMMGQSRQSVQRLANEMIKDHLIETQFNPNHERAKLLALTKKGHETFQKAMEKQIMWVNSIASHLDAIQLNSTLCILKEFSSELTSSLLIKE